MFHSKRAITRGLSSLLLLIVLLAGVAPGVVPGSSMANAQQAVRFFPETRESVSGRFLQYWDTHGGLAQQGFPISNEIVERSPVDGKTYTVQYFERAIFEMHPENQPPNDVLLSLLGAFRYQQKYPTGIRGQSPDTSLGSVLFKETGKRIGGAFLAYWQQHGGLAQQGYPISDVFSELSDFDGHAYRVQYFERAVFEMHPEHAAPNNVLLSQLGTLRARQNYGNPPLFPGTPGATNIPTLRTLTGHAVAVNSVAFSPNGQTLASGSQDTTIKLWRLSDGSVVRTLTGHTDPVNSVAFSPDGQTLASGSYDGTIKLWKVSDGSVIRTLTEHTDPVNSVAFSPDGQTLASASFDSTVKLWRVSDGSVIRTFTGYRNAMISVTFSPDGQSLAFASDDKTVKLWRISDGAVTRTLTGHTGPVGSVAFSPDGQTLASSSLEVKLWKVSDGSLIRTFTGYTSSGLSVAYSPDGQTLASAGTNDGTIKLGRVSDGSLIRTLTGHTGYVHSVAYSPDGQTLASGSNDATIKLWKVK